MGKRSVLPIAVLFAGLPVAFVWPIFEVTMGDGYIVSRYAENLIDSGEPAFNLGERIWSFTSPLHTLLQAGYYALTGATQIANKVVSLACILLGAWVITRRFAVGLAEKTFCFALLLLSPCLLYWAINGLETAHLFPIIALFVVVAHRSALARPTPRDIARLSLLAGIAILFRYDSLLVVAPVLFIAIVRAGLSPRVFLAALPGPVLVLAWVGFAWLYYHDLVPTSFHHKTPSVLGWELRANAVYELQFWVVSGLFLTVFWVFVRRKPLREGFRALPTLFRTHAGLFVGLFLFFAYGLTAATKHMMFGYRLFLPMVPAVLVAQLLVVRAFTASAGERPPARILPAVLAALAVLVQVGAGAYVMFRGTNPTWRGEFRDFSALEMRGWSRDLWDVEAAQIAAHWTQHQQPGVTPRLYTGEAGQVPYRLKFLYVLDTGLVSYREKCPGTDWHEYAHYSRLQDPKRERIAPNSQVTFLANPKPNPLPPRVDLPCGPLKETLAQDASGPRAGTDSAAR